MMLSMSIFFAARFFSEQDVKNILIFQRIKNPSGVSGINLRYRAEQWEGSLSHSEGIYFCAETGRRTWNEKKFN